MVVENKAFTRVVVFDMSAACHLEQDFGPSSMTTCSNRQQAVLTGLGLRTPAASRAGHVLSRQECQTVFGELQKSASR